MSGAPNQRRMTQAEMAFTSVEAGKRAERRASLLERRLAVAEDRMAEQDRTISELASGLQDASDTISAFHVVLKELQEQTGKGVEQVLTGLDSRLMQLAQDMDAFTAAHERRLGDLESMRPRYQKFFDVLIEDMPTISQLQRKGGRPLGSKNKPKVENPPAEDGENAVSMEQQPEGDSQ